MKKILLLFLSLFLFSSCVTKYYNVVLEDDALIRESRYNISDIDTVLVSGSQVYLSKTKYFNGLKKLKINNKYYWSNNLRYRLFDGNYVNVVKETQNQTSTPSYNYSSSSSKSTGGTVHVKGYYRKNGTYVRPHTRSAPRRR